MPKLWGKKELHLVEKAISRYQVNEIIKSPVERVIILFDPDAKDRRNRFGI